MSTTAVAAAFDESRGQVLLADWDNSGSRLAAVDARSGALRWITNKHDTPFMMGCHGIALLPSAGVCIATSIGDDTLCVHRLEDGERLATCKVPRAWHVAADAASGLVYCANNNEVGVYTWTGSVLKHLPERSFQAGSHQTGSGPTCVTVVPRVGRSPAYLLVCQRSGPKLLYVYALPGHVRVHSTTLSEEDVPARGYLVGLAADASGTALLLCVSGGYGHSDSADRTPVRVVPWPLPGMPALPVE
jgi:hypothetical protein